MDGCVSYLIRTGGSVIVRGAVKVDRLELAMRVIIGDGLELNHASIKIQNPAQTATLLWHIQPPSVSKPLRYRFHHPAVLHFVAISKPLHRRTEMNKSDRNRSNWKWWAIICGIIVFGGLVSKMNEAREESAIAKLTPKCNTPTKSGDASCWLKVAARKSCWTWNEIVTDNEMFEWSGRCKNGLLHGRGEESWRDSRNKSTGAGSYQNGKKRGDWVERFGRGDAPNEGSYKNGKRHGRWIFPFADDLVMEGSFKDGKQHGQWVLRFADGVILRRECYVNGIGIGRC